MNSSTINGATINGSSQIQAIIITGFSSLLLSPYPDNDIFSVDPAQTESLNIDSDLFAVDPEKVTFTGEDTDPFNVDPNQVRQII